MKENRTYLSVKQVVQVLVEKNVVSEQVAEVLMIPRYWTEETPLVEDAPTMLFEDLVKLAGYTLHYQENLDTKENEYWLDPLPAAS
ncbi:hypothetical protein ACJQ40_001946 [Enterococcus faecium]|nr:hypothetical protein [Enterococcus faecium]